MLTIGMGGGREGNIFVWDGRMKGTFVCDNPSWVLIAPPMSAIRLPIPIDCFLTNAHYLKS